MRRRILTALAILLGEPIPHEWTDCPNWVYGGQKPPVGWSRSDKYDESVIPYYRRTRPRHPVAIEHLAWRTVDSNQPVPEDWEMP